MKNNKKGNVYLGNAFSIQMLDVATEKEVRITPVCSSEVATSNFKSVIGHKDTSKVISSMLMMDVEFNRESITLGDNDILYVAQITGGRLPEGVTELPENFAIKFVKVEII